MRKTIISVDVIPLLVSACPSSCFLFPYLFFLEESLILKMHFLTLVITIRLYKREDNWNYYIIIPHPDTILFHGQLFKGKKKKPQSKNRIGSQRFNKKYYKFGKNSL